MPPQKRRRRAALRVANAVLPRPATARLLLKRRRRRRRERQLTPSPLRCDDCGARAARARRVRRKHAPLPRRSLRKHIIPVLPALALAQSQPEREGRRSTSLSRHAPRCGSVRPQP